MTPGGFPSAPGGGPASVCSGDVAGSAGSECKALRSALFRLFLVAMSDEDLPAGDFDLVNEALGPALEHMRGVPGEKGLEPGFSSLVSASWVGRSAGGATAVPNHENSRGVASELCGRSLMG